ncbi:cytochrome c [Mesorhizobium sp. M1027]|uniref:c-type cytochrome n=1 Tax=Mesorhizobium sp. M1027 TaxID=2957050 RepID=UPI003338E13E
MRSKLSKLVIGAGTAIAVLAAAWAALTLWPERVIRVAHKTDNATSSIGVRATSRFTPSGPILGAAAIVVLVAVLAGIALYFEQSRRVEQKADNATGGVGARAIPIMMANGCAGCHTIAGVPGAQGMVGPRLDASLATRVYIGGVLSNNPRNMVRWIRAAREINPHTAMPSTRISEQEARDIAAYLYSMK